jgi:hypothetical protein
MEVLMKRLLLLAIASVVFAPTAAQGATGHTIDLASGRLDGHDILGRTIPAVTAALGRPDFRAGSKSRYRIGWGSEANFRIEVLFATRDGKERATSIVLERSPIRDPKLGELLGLSSPALQTAMRTRYPGAYKLLRPYTCKSNHECVGEFAARNGTLHITFGTHNRLGTWLNVWQASTS